MEVLSGRSPRSARSAISARALSENDVMCPYPLASGTIAPAPKATIPAPAAAVATTVAYLLREGTPARRRPQ
ncbi:hypothetical protein GCM10009679_10580 [Saccharothrix algeriensis]|uniref:Uncharacterized protein n=1 Tax=Catellatospora bangladeshensis TaxID=310355 RepID=A0A8J3JK50_9ACTN|nr:hypothetical protein Cba03nite_35270 [Catellatospora bangladeshensis]